MPADEQGRAELLDDDKLPDEEFPPEQPMGVDVYGTTAAEERAGEPLAEAWSRQLADVPEGARAADAAVNEVLLEDGAVDDIVGSELELDALREDERDIAQEKEGATPAEEAALHIEE